MQKMKLVLTGVLVMALFGIAACTEAGTSPGSAVDTGDGADSVAAVLSNLPPTQRMDFQDLVKAIGENPDGSQDLEAFRAWLAEQCPSDGNCAADVNPDIAKVALALLYAERSATDTRAGIYNSKFPQAKDVEAAYNAATGRDSDGSAGGTGGDTGGEPGKETGGDAGSSVSGAVGNALSDLYKEVLAADGSVTLADIRDKAQATNPDSGAIVADAIKTELRTVPSDNPAHEAAKTLSDGGEVSPQDAVDALKAVEDKVAKRVEQATGDDGAAGGGAGSTGSTLDALLAAMGKMREIDWTGIERQIDQIDPDFGEEIKVQLRDGLNSIPEDAPEYVFAHDLIDGAAVPAIEAVSVVKAAAKIAGLDR